MSASGPEGGNHRQARSLAPHGPPAGLRREAGETSDTQYSTEVPSRASRSWPAHVSRDDRYQSD